MMQSLEERIDSLVENRVEAALTDMSTVSEIVKSFAVHVLMGDDGGGDNDDDDDDRDDDDDDDDSTLHVAATAAVQTEVRLYHQQDRYVCGCRVQFCAWQDRYVS
jgi:hypothetical protein